MTATFPLPDLARDVRLFIAAKLFVNEVTVKELELGAAAAVDVKAPAPTTDPSRPATTPIVAILRPRFRCKCFDTMSLPPSCLGSVLPLTPTLSGDYPREYIIET